MRLNRENTLIENNQYPLAGNNPQQAQDYLVKACTPYKEYFDQVQAGLFLHNPLMYIFLVVFTLLTCCVFVWIKNVFGSLALGIVIVPYFYLFYCFGFIEKVFVKYLYIKKLPEITADKRDHIRSLEEIFAIVWCPVVWVWRIGFFIYRVFVCPNGIDVAVFIVAVFILSILSRVFNFIILVAFFILLFLVLAPVYSRTQLLDKLIEIIKNLTKKTQTKVNEVKAQAQKTEEPAKTEAPEAEDQPLTITIDCPGENDERKKITINNFDPNQTIGDFVTSFCEEQKFTGNGWSLFNGRTQLPVDGTFAEYEVTSGSELEVIQVDNVDDDAELEAALAN